MSQDHQPEFSLSGNGGDNLSRDTANTGDLNSQFLADAGYFAKTNDSSTLPREVTESFNLLRKGDLNGFTNYFFNNPDAQSSIKSALADKGIDLYVDRPKTDSVSGKIALSTLVKGIEPLSRTLLIDGKNPPEANLLYPAGANYDTLRSRFLQAGNKIDVGEHTREIQQRLLPPRTPVKTMFG